MQQNHPMLRSITDCLTVTLVAGLATWVAVFMIALGAFLWNDVIF